MMARLPADQQVTCRLAAAVIRLTASLRAGDVTAAASAVGHAELLLGQVTDGKPAWRLDLRRRVLTGRAAVEMWSGHPGQAASALEAGMAADAAFGGEHEQAIWAGHLALAEALRGRLRRAAALADQAVLTAGERMPPGGHPDPAPLVALAWVHLERNELRGTRSCLKQADAALGENPDNLIRAVAYLVAAGGALAEGRAAVATRIVTRARSGGPVPGWLDQQLSLVESRAFAAAGDIRASLAAAERAGDGTSPEAAVTLAHAWAIAGDDGNAARSLVPVLAPDAARGRRSLAAALRMAEREQFRLPFAMERGWLGPVLRRDRELACAHRGVLALALGQEQLPASATAPDQVLVVEPLTEREREVLQHVSGMLNTAEVASEMYISVNTVKTHLRSIYRKLAADHRGEAVRRARELQLI